MGMVIGLDLPAWNIIIRLFNCYSPHPFSRFPAAPLSPSLCPGAPPGLLRPHLWCGGRQALLWSLVDEWVSGGPRVRNGSCVCSLPATVKIYYLWNGAPQRSQRTQSQCSRILCVLCALCGEILMNSSPPPSPCSPAPSFLHSTQVPHRSAPPALVVWGLAGAFRLLRRALGAKWGWMLGWGVAGRGLRLKYK